MSSSMSTPPSSAPEKKPAWNKNPLFWVSIVGGLVLAALIITLTVLFTGTNGDKSEPDPQPSATVTVSPEPEKESEPKETVEAKDLTPNFDAVPKGNIETEEGFADYIRDVFPVLEDAPDSEITEIAENTCNLLDEGKSFPEALATAGKDAKSMDEGGAYGGISGLAVVVLCPEYEDEMEEYSS